VPGSCKRSSLFHQKSFITSCQGEEEKLWKKVFHFGMLIFCFCKIEEFWAGLIFNGAFNIFDYFTVKIEISKL
jgi:hypothetical protein